MDQSWGVLTFLKLLIDGEDLLERDGSWFCLLLTYEAKRAGSELTRSMTCSISRTKPYFCLWTLDQLSRGILLTVIFVRYELVSLGIPCIGCLVTGRARTISFSMTQRSASGTHRPKQRD